MEMIAMLNGLGRTPGPANRYLPPGVNPSYDLYRYKLNGFGAAMSNATYDQLLVLLAAAKTKEDYDNVLASIDASPALTPDQVADLKKRVEDAQKKWYQNPWVWVGVAAAAWVGYRYYTGQPVLPGFSGHRRMRRY